MKPLEEWEGKDLSRICLNGRAIMFKPCLDLELNFIEPRHGTQLETIRNLRESRSIQIPIESVSFRLKWKTTLVT